MEALSAQISLLASSASSQMQYSSPSGVMIKPAAGKGRGVFATKFFKKGTTIEICPVIPLSATERDEVDKTVLYNIRYDWDENSQGGAIALGYGSVYNHSYKPNASYNKDLACEIIQIIALRDIQAGEEITINYNGEPSDTTPLWFAVAPDS